MRGRIELVPSDWEKFVAFVRQKCGEIAECDDTGEELVAVQSVIEKFEAQLAAEGGRREDATIGYRCS